MARRQKHYGACHICGNVGPLTFEHVPPEAAFNSRPILLGTLDEMLNKGLDQPLAHGIKQQRGAGAYTLCERCNTLTGRWYGREYVDWCYQGVRIIKNASKDGTKLLVPFYITPLRIMKQIITMFFTANGENFRCAQPELVEFVLNKEKKYFNPRVRIYTYFTVGNALRQMGATGIVKPFAGKMYTVSEISFPPFGYVMTFDCYPPDDRLIDITYFSRYDYNYFGVLYLKLPVLPVHMFFPGDYRTREQILEDYKKVTAQAVRSQLNN